MPISYHCGVSELWVSQQTSSQCISKADFLFGAAGILTQTLSLSTFSFLSGTWLQHFNAISVYHRGSTYKLFTVLREKHQSCHPEKFGFVLLLIYIVPQHKATTIWT